MIPSDLDYVCPVSGCSDIVSEILLMKIQVLQEDVRHCLRFSHPASQV
jgi:hypothetical protein